MAVTPPPPSRAVTRWNRRLRPTATAVESVSVPPPSTAAYGHDRRCFGFLHRHSTTVVTAGAPSVTPRGKTNSLLRIRLCHRARLPLRCILFLSFDATIYQQKALDINENRPDTIPLEDFKMLLKYWGDESIKSLAEENAARRNTLAETHTMGPRTHAQAKEKLKKDPKIAKPSDAEIYLETYKRDPERTYKTDTGELRTKYVNASSGIRECWKDC
ncbi:hypothetical protein OROMI_012761 [Orobanche minor]